MVFSRHTKYNANNVGQLSVDCVVGIQFVAWVYHQCVAGGECVGHTELVGYGEGDKAPNTDSLKLVVVCGEDTVHHIALVMLIVHDISLELLPVISVNIMFDATQVQPGPVVLM